MPDAMQDNWSPTKFGTLAKRLVNGGTPPTEVARYWKGSIPWVTGADFTPAGIGKFRRFVSEEAVRNTSTNVIEKGNLLLVTRTGVGKLAIAPCDIAISQDITGIYPDTDQVDTEFLFHRMRQGVEDLKKLNQGTSINGIIRDDLIRYSIELPPLQKQKRIAEILSTVDDAIETTEAMIAKTQQIKAGLMHDLFTRGITPDGQLRLPRDEAPQLYKESPLGWIPKQWDSGGLGSRCCSGRPHLKTGPFGSSLKLEHWVEEGVPVITIGSLGEGHFIESELLHVSELTAKRLHDYRLTEGDIVFSRVADVGRSAVIEHDQSGWVMSSNLMRISLDPALVDAHFLQAQLAYSAKIRGQIRATVNTGGREVANSETLNRLRFAWPEKEEQDRIVQLMSLVNVFQSDDKQCLSKLRRYKQGLANDLLSGRVAI